MDGLHLPLAEEHLHETRLEEVKSLLRVAEKRGGGEGGRGEGEGGMEKGRTRK